MTFNIALNFEDGITRFIQCHAGEKVLDAAYRQRVNLPMDCSDGVCGTCKCHCASGEYDLGEDYLDEALSDDEAQARQVLTCQMVPTSDCVIDVPVAAAQCKTALATLGAQVRQVNLLSDTAIELVVALDEPLAFLPGQYVNIQVPGTPHVYGSETTAVARVATARVEHEPVVNPAGAARRSSYPQRPDGQLLSAPRRTSAADAGGRYRPGAAALHAPYPADTGQPASGDAAVRCYS